MVRSYYQSGDSFLLHVYGSAGWLPLLLPVVPPEIFGVFMFGLRLSTGLSLRYIIWNS